MELPRLRKFNYIQIETPKEKLDRLVNEYNDMGGKPATATNISNMKLTRQTINTLLINNPSLGPVKLKEYGYYTKEPGSSRAIKI
jgi:hypothetical protein